MRSGKEMYMEVIVGSIVIKNNNILMVKESKKECYGKWAFPAGHIEKNETLLEGAIRETFEETGCLVELKKVLPIIVDNGNDRNIMMIYFVADLIKDKENYSSTEILETKWINVNEINKIDKNEFRCYPVIKNVIESLEKKQMYDLTVLRDCKLF